MQFIRLYIKGGVWAIPSYAKYSLLRKKGKSNTTYKVELTSENEAVIKLCLSLFKGVLKYTSSIADYTQCKCNIL